jgi:hypothetical protein
MDNLYDINFQYNVGFCKIHIRYNNINHLSTVDRLTLAVENIHNR